DRDEADRSIFGAVALSRDIALAGVDRELHADLCALVEGAQDVIRIEDLDVANGLDVTSRHNTRPLLAHDHALRALAFHADGDFLDVEDDVGDVFTNTVDRRELVENAVDLNCGHGCAA